MSPRLHQLIADVKPFEGRFGMTWRISLLCALVAAVAMIYKIPEPAIGCYLIIYLMKPDASTNIVLAIGATILVTVFVALVFVLTRWTIEVPFLRLAVMAFASFAFVYLGSVSKLGDLGSDMALVITFALTLVSAAPLGEVVTRGLLYAWQMVTMPMALMLCFNMVLGWKPSRLLRKTWRERVEAAEQHLLRHDAESAARLHELLDEGNAEHDQRALLTRILHYVPKRVTNQLAQAIEQSYALMLAVSALPATIPDDAREKLAAQCREVAEAIATKTAIPAPGEQPATDDAALAAAWQALRGMADPDPTWPAMPQEPFFAADALSNPAHQRFALKTTLAAMIAYIVYAGIDWQGIHTAMITCFVASLGTTGETVHKLTLRIIGCLIGAALGIGAILFVIPNLTSVGGLMVLVFVGLLPAAWVASGSERIAYGGVQIGLAFLLTVLQGFEPSLDMGTARDRIVGILLGNLLVYLIFTRIWPVGVVVGVRAGLSSALAGLARLATMPPQGDNRARVNEAAAAVADLRHAADQLAWAPYEPAALRPEPAAMRRFEAVLAEAEPLAASLFLAGSADPDQAARLQRLSLAIADAKRLAAEATQSADPKAAPHDTAAERIARIENALVT